MPTIRDDTPLARQPGDDGWRTPTIEDSDHPLNLRLVNGSRRAQLVEQLHGLQPRKERLAPQHSAETSQDYPTNLTWKQRVKHVTWAWFTMTMATGGIANVLSSGKTFQSGFECTDKSSSVSLQGS